MIVVGLICGFLSGAVGAWALYLLGDWIWHGCKQRFPYADD